MSPPESMAGAVGLAHPLASGRRPAPTEAPARDRAIGIAIVLALHAAALYGAWTYRLLPTPAEAATLFVNLVSHRPPPAPAPELKREPAKPVPVDRRTPVEPPPQQQIVAEAPVVAPAEPVAPPPPPPPPVVAPVEVVAPPPAPVSTGPVTLAEELAVSCPQRTPPAYPRLSRRAGEQGRAILRVELDEYGAVAAVRVATSSGSARLDDAAIEAVRQWRCNPAKRQGTAVRAVALQPFNFVIEGQ